MSQPSDGPPDDAVPDDGVRGDPWMAFGYLVAGVLVYGSIGFLLDLWWGTSFVVALGILLGAGLGMYMTFARFRAPHDEPDAHRS